MKYRISHMDVRGEYVIIVQVDDAFDTVGAEKQEATRSALQTCAKAAKLKGSVALIWQADGATRYICPPVWESFFSTLTLDTVLAHLNKELDCTVR